MKLPLLLAALAPCLFTMSHAADSKIAAQAINELGLDLYRTEPTGNLLLSPYSIQSALALTYAGAAGDTYAEMQRVLHYPSDDDALHRSLGTLAEQLTTAAKNSATRVKKGAKLGGPNTPLQFNIANRLYGQTGYAFRPPYLALIKDRYQAPLEPTDFKADPEKARVTINRWVGKQTHDRIRDLIPPRTILPDMRLVLVNALYLKAAWADEFSELSTKPAAFYANGRDAVQVPTMTSHRACRYAKHDGFQIVTRAYEGDELQFVIVLPDDRTGLAAVDRKLTAKILAECSDLAFQDVILHLPKFRLEPPTLTLTEKLQELGMKTACDKPEGSANFDGIAPRKPDDYLYIGAVLHKTFLALDEKGTEAAAATAILMPRGAGIPQEKPKPIEIHVDRPFLFAIQHRASGACLFLGRVTDPR